jgi:hypothetical protein
VLHIRPWELETLALDDFLALCEWLDEWNKPADE